MLALLGAAYAVILVVDDPPLDTRSAIVGATLLAIGELAYRSIEARAAVTEEAGTVTRRVGPVAILALIALGLGGTILAVTDLLRSGGLAIEISRYRGGCGCSRPPRRRSSQRPDTD